MNQTSYCLSMLKKLLEKQFIEKIKEDERIMEKV